MISLPSEADVVIIGGGVVGASTAYHLSKLGLRDTIVLERNEITSGTTWHAAGLVGQLRQSRNLTELAKYSADLFAALEAETGQATGFRQNGAVSIALTEGRMDELRRGASMGRNFGLDVEVLSPSDVAQKLPLFSTQSVKGGVFLPKDGTINPVDLTHAYVTGARRNGVKLFEHTKVVRIIVEGGVARGVETDKGHIKSRKVVIAAGMWSRDLGILTGANIPLQPVQHFYAVTEAIPELPADMPFVRVFEECAYYKEDAGKLLLGAFEQDAKPWAGLNFNDEQAFITLPGDFDHFSPILERAVRRFPALERAGITLFFNGPESFTPDGSYHLGETPEVGSLFVAAGFNSIGIMSSGGAGRVLADWIANERPPMDLNGVDIRRCHPFQSSRAYLWDRGAEAPSLVYAPHWPYRQFETARGARHSPYHAQLKDLGAVFGELAGWERPNWFAVGGVEPVYEYSFGRQNWWPCADFEAKRMMSDCALFDHSSYAKFLVQGKDSVQALNWICANEINVEPGKIVYTQWLNARGGIEADLTVTRLDERKFLIVTTTAGQVRDFSWLTRHIPEDARCATTDITSGLSMLAIMGPKSRSLLEALTREDLSDVAFPFATSREVEIGYARVRASRITYVGELGYEIYIPSEFATHVFERIWEAGRAFGLIPAGFHTLNNCRVEKAYRHWGHDITDEDTPLEAGLSFAVALGKSVGFIGRDAIASQAHQKKRRKRLVNLALIQTDERTPLMYHDEPIYRNGSLVGSLTSGAWGHRVERSLGMGYVSHADGVSSDWLASGDWEVEISAVRYPATVQLKPFYDPDRLKT